MKKMLGESFGERVATLMLWPVSLMAYIMVILGGLNVIAWLWSILQMRLCGSCGPCVMR